MADLPVGDPDDDSVIVGPVINQLSKSEIMEAISRAEHDGGEVVAAPTPDAKGFYVAPTIVLNLQADHHLNQEEVFGPVISVLAASSSDEAFELERRTRFGLVTSVFTRKRLCGNKAIQKSPVLRKSLDVLWATPGKFISNGQLSHGSIREEISIQVAASALQRSRRFTRSAASPLVSFNAWE